MLDGELLEYMSGEQKVYRYVDFAPRQSKDSSVNTEYRKSGSSLEASIIAEKLPRIAFTSSRVVGREMGSAEF